VPGARLRGRAALGRAGGRADRAVPRTDPKGDQLKTWPSDLRIIARREAPHPGAQLSLFEQCQGYRFQLTATNLTSTDVHTSNDVQLLEATHRPPGPRGVPHPLRQRHRPAPHALKSFAINFAWYVVVALACDLLAWLALLGLDGDLAKAEPKTLRYRLLHTAGRIVRGQRKRRLRIPQTWPWARQLQTAFTRIAALPAPRLNPTPPPLRARKEPVRSVEPAPTRYDNRAFCHTQIPK